MVDILEVPESLFMLFDTVVAYDHFFQAVKIITYLKVPSTLDDDSLAAAYDAAHATIQRTVATLLSSDLPLPAQGPIRTNHEYTSNIGQTGYEAHVRRLKKHISVGDIIQAVPSQRFARPTDLHPFNVYRQLRAVNPSPYLFFVDCDTFQIVGASPELLVKSEPISSPSTPPQQRIITHPIAGTVKRGLTPADDDRLAATLLASLKDRAEHVMLVDLARNDVNRVCDPLTTRVDALMRVQRFSHVQHLVSQVSGVLRPGKTRFDAFRSIFPAGTVSGAPKVRAMQLIAELEREKRGVYAGAVGYFGYNSVSVSAGDGDGDARLVLREEEGAMDTCIALRTMVVKNSTAYLQAGGGIVFDSDPFEEWEETMNKLRANMTCIAGAEKRYAEEQEGVASAGVGGAGAREKGEALVKELVDGEAVGGGRVGELGVEEQQPQQGKTGQGKPYIDLSGE